MAIINGEKENVDGMTLYSYLEDNGYSLGRIAVERNGDIVPKSEYQKTILEQDDHIEVVSFVGGG